ncbi:MAG: MltA domain-containing protein [Elusimicrobiota bacterium]
MRKILLIGPFFLYGCTLFPNRMSPKTAPAEPVSQAPAAPVEPPIALVPPELWPRITDDLPVESLERAAQADISYLRRSPEKLYKFGDLEVGSQGLIDTAEELVRIRKESSGPEELAARLKAGFDLYRVGPATGALFSSYYSPTLEASKTPTDGFKYPLFRKPTDMIEVDLSSFSAKWKGEHLIGRLDANGRFVPYFDRLDIDVREALKDRGLEFAWLKSSFDRLDLHIEGSGVLRFTDGEEALARFAATNARPYKSVGLSLAGSGAVTREELTAQTLKRYLEEHPEGEAWIISQNPRYTFFELAPIPPGGEPFGTINEPLTAGRSFAVDTAIVPLGMPAYAEFPMIQADSSGGTLGKAVTRRFAFCQDTGGAIKGAGRIDVYVGHGPEAKSAASRVWDKGSLYILLKKLPPRQR